MRNALAMLTMSWGETRTRIGFSSRVSQERRVVPFGLEHGGEAALLDRLEVRLLRLDQLRLDQLEQCVIQRDHAGLPVGLHDRRDLEGLPLADQVGDGG